MASDLGHGKSYTFPKSGIKEAADTAQSNRSNSTPGDNCVLQGFNNKGFDVELENISPGKYS